MDRDEILVRYAEKVLMSIEEAWTPQLRAKLSVPGSSKKILKFSNFACEGAVSVPRAEVEDCQLPYC